MTKQPPERVKCKGRDFPGGPVDKNLPAKARGTGSVPSQGTKIPHASEQVNPHTTTSEPTCSGTYVPQERPDATR